MRVKTRPDIKWLINEAAALNGRRERLEGQLKEISDELSDVIEARNACVLTLNLITSAQSKSPGMTLPTVNAHRDYGDWGGLRKFVCETLASVAPEAMDGFQLALLAEARLGLKFSCAEEFRRFRRNSLGNVLRYYRAKGVVETAEAPSSNPRHIPMWRWKSGCSFDELQRVSDDIADVSPAATRSRLARKK
jgi:hypothetical protein